MATNKALPAIFVGQSSLFSLLPYFHHFGTRIASAIQYCLYFSNQSHPSKAGFMGKGIFDTPTASLILEKKAMRITDYRDEQ